MEVRIGTLNVGTMTGKGRELADMMEDRLYVSCVCKRREVRPGALVLG